MTANRLEGAPSWSWKALIALAMGSLTLIKVLGGSTGKKSGSASPAATAVPAQASAVKIIPWEPGVPVTKLTEAVTCFELKLNEWSPAFQGPPLSLVEVKTPSPAQDWWFSTGEIISGDEIRVLKENQRWRFPAAVFRIRDRGGEGQAAIAIQEMATATAQTPVPRLVGRVPWESGVPIKKLTEGVICIELKLSQWSEAFEAPAATRVIAHTPSPAAEWWFLTGEVIRSSGSNQYSLGRFPSAVFRIRDLGAEGKAAICVYE